jgi:hypothetical protein
MGPAQSLRPKKGQGSRGTDGRARFAGDRLMEKARRRHSDMVYLSRYEAPLQFVGSGRWSLRVNRRMHDEDEGKVGERSGLRQLCQNCGWSMWRGGAVGDAGQGLEHLIACRSSRLSTWNSHVIPPESNLCTGFRSCVGMEMADGTL